MNSEYADRDPRKLEPHYSKHVSAMTREALHSKHAIAEELAYRDQKIERLEAVVSAIRRLNINGHPLSDYDTPLRVALAALEQANNSDYTHYSLDDGL